MLQEVYFTLIRRHVSVAEFVNVGGFILAVEDIRHELMGFCQFPYP